MREGGAKKKRQTENGVLAQLPLPAGWPISISVLFLSPSLSVPNSLDFWERIPAPRPADGRPGFHIPLLASGSHRAIAQAAPTLPSPSWPRSAWPVFCPRPLPHPPPSTPSVPFVGPPAALGGGRGGTAAQKQAGMELCQRACAWRRQKAEVIDGAGPQNGAV